MEININNNLFRLMAKNFLHLQPVKEGICVKGGKYNCVNDKYGNLGQV